MASFLPEIFNIQKQDIFALCSIAQLKTCCLQYEAKKRGLLYFIPRFLSSQWFTFRNSVRREDCKYRQRLMNNVSPLA